MQRLDHLALASLLLAGIGTAAAQPDSGSLAIESAAADLTQELLFISGSGFTPSTRVWLLGQRELVVLNVAPELVEAELPATVAPGTYRLVVSTKRAGSPRQSASQVASLDVTIGAAGPQGPPGAPGAPGQKGDTGAPGAPGATWTSGIGAPDPSSGRDGDFYLDADTGDVYVKTDPTWSLVTNLTGPEGPAGEPGTSDDPIAALANRLGVHRPDIRVPVEALRPAQCTSGDSAFMFIDGNQTGSVVGLWGRERLNDAYEFHILLQDDGGRPGDGFLRRPGGLKIMTAGGTLEPQGVITKSSLLGSDAAGSLYILTLRARLALGDYASAFNAFQDQSYSDIMAFVIADIGIQGQLEAIPSVNDGYEVQYNETHLQFLKRLAEEAGAFFYTRDDGTVVVSTNSGSFEPGPALPYFGPFADAGGVAAISSLSTGAGLAPRRVTTHGWDSVAKEIVEGMSDAEGLLPTSFVFDPAYTTTDGAERGAQNLYARARVGAAARQGTSNAPGIRAGRTIAVSGASGGFSGSYYVASVHHVLVPEKDSGCFSYANQFVAVPSSVPYRPPVLTPRPRVHGLQTAVVSNASDDDGLGRVKVKFPWITDGVESNWARVVALVFGSQRYRPQVNDEVLVAFIGGDPRQPVVVGGLWNGVDRPPN